MFSPLVSGMKNIVFSTGTWSGTASEQSGLTPSTEPSSTHCKRGEKKKKKVVFPSRVRVDAVLSNQKRKENQKVPVNKYDVRLNTDWRPVVFPSRHPAVLKIMLIFCNVKFRKTKQNPKRKKSRCNIAKMKAAA